MDPSENGNVSSHENGNGSSHHNENGEENVGEQVKLTQMKSILQQHHDPSLNTIDDATLRRFLRARDLNVEKASKFFVNYLNWRKIFVPLGYIPESEVSNELAKKKIFIQGVDKQGRPVGVILASKHKSSDRNIEEFKRLVVYGFDKICSTMSSGTEKFVIIADLQGWGHKNMDIRGSLAALEIMQNYYPERLGKVFMVHVPYVFWAAWKVVYPFIDKITKEKIIFVEDKNVKEVLFNDIDESQLPERFGGRLPLVPAQDCMPRD